MNPTMTAGLATAFAVFTVACSGGGAAPPPATTLAAAPAAATARSTGAIADGDYGVPACDQYMRKYAACVDSKVPESMREIMKQQMQQNHLAWKQASSTPEGRQGMTAACTQAEATAKQAMASYGCSW